MKKRILHFFHQKVFHYQLAFGIFFLNLFGNRELAKKRMEAIAQCAPGTLGYSIYNLMISNNLDFVPWYEGHDMKHALLGYRQQASDEIRMQAFMFGNAGFSCFSILTFLMFVIWTPDTWADLPQHYRAGKLTRPIGHWVLEDVMHSDIDMLRREIGLAAAFEKANLRIGR